MAKIQKSLDLNKLFIAQSQGKILRKNIAWPMLGSIKYDGNYTTIIKEAQGLIRYISSGGHEYTNNECTIFDLPNIPCGVYVAERIATDGKLGDRKNCALRGPRGNQTAYGHIYMVHDYLSLSGYERGQSYEGYFDRTFDIRDILGDYWIGNIRIHDQADADKYLAQVVKNGYEGIMLKSPDWIWKNTKSRTIDCVKYKKRPTVDLLCIGYTEGTGKYEGLIGSLKLSDSAGRVVDVGSGMSDEDRYRNPTYFIGSVVEMFYEQIMATYIQPTFGDEYEGVLIRDDKTAEDID